MNSFVKLAGRFTRPDPKNLTAEQQKVVDEVIGVSDEDAMDTSLALTRSEGLLVGISAGANAWAAIQVAQRLGPGKHVVTILCDTGERYLSVDALWGTPAA